MKWRGDWENHPANTAGGHWFVHKVSGARNRTRLRAGPSDVRPEREALCDNDKRPLGGRRGAGRLGRRRGARRSLGAPPDARPARRAGGRAGVALCDPRGHSLGAQGPGAHHVDEVAETVKIALRSDRRQLATLPPCDVPGCAVSRAVVVPLIASGERAGALVVLTGTAVGPYLIRAADETSRFITTQLELSDLDSSRADLARAEVRALRAQISPHFIYNALTTIAAFVRSDPDRARELLLEFADFTRYSFRQAGEYTTLAD